jgi:uncharacterized small protein (DUF1192 family)
VAILQNWWPFYKAGGHFTKLVAILQIGLPLHLLDATKDVDKKVLILQDEVARLKHHIAQLKRILASANVY